MSKEYLDTLIDQYLEQNKTTPLEVRDGYRDGYNTGLGVGNGLGKKKIKELERSLGASLAKIGELNVELVGLRADIGKLKGDLVYAKSKVDIADSIVKQLTAELDELKVDKEQDFELGEPE